MRVHIDPSARSYVVVCACGWRDLTLSRADAWAQARTHEARAHPGDRDTLQGTYRHAGNTPGMPRNR